MNNTKSPRFLECLVGLQCQLLPSDSPNYLIIDVDPETNALALLNNGRIQRAGFTEIWLTKKSQNELTKNVTKKVGKPYRVTRCPIRPSTGLV